jgi:hypothetical protein
MYLAGLPSSTTDWTVKPHPICALARPGGTRSVVKFTDACSNSVKFPALRHRARGSSFQGEPLQPRISVLAHVL